MIDLREPTKIRSTTNASRKLVMAHRCCGVMLGRNQIVRAANSHISPLPLCSSSIMYFRGIERDEVWNSLTDTARSHADHDFGTV